MKTAINFICFILLLSFTLTSSVYAQERKGWSPQAKGAVIGTAGGAVLGSVINKRNRAVGGVVGGVVGGAGGYAVGKSIDNKNKAKAAEARAAEARHAAYRANQRAIAAERKAKAANARAEALAAKNAATPDAAAIPAVMAYADAQTAMPTSMYIVNNTPEDRSKPYSESEYKRKSW
ncbi:hypothetical protein GCM10023185_32290 [Hymenobacter saemangeumensis]|uniref:Glycine zipper domain-containing protein n=1 Tax=Hymenobacter saemangeumensis TaxID=1084522 RepID=A0ABP8IMP8_9BACT